MKGRTLLFTATLLAFATGAFAQTLDSPESVEYDAANDRYLISNTGTNEILAQDQMGNLSVFTSTSSSPYGIEIVGTTLYVCEAPGTVKGYDLTSGAEVFTANTGAGFVNGITTDGTDLFVSDFSGDQILKVEIATQAVSTVVANTNGTPNGLVYFAPLNAVFVAFWGPAAPVKAYVVATGTELYAVPTNLTNIDGIAIDCNSLVYISSWSPDQISTLAPGQTSLGTMTWAVDNPADMDYDMVHHRVCIPNVANNTVSLETVTACTTSIEEEEAQLPLVVYPVPASTELTVLTNEAAQTAYSIVDLQGRVLDRGVVYDRGAIDLADLASGQYVLNLEDGRTEMFVKE